MSTNTILASAPLTTTNYILKATGTTLGNSLIWDNGTNVGVGNTNTSYTLDVSGTIRSTTSAYFATTSGNVGIGTSSPSATLQVLSSSTTANPSVLIENQGPTATSLLYFKNSAARQMLIGYTGASYSGGEYGVIDVLGAYPLTFSTTDTERMRITSGGNVYFNTASGSGNLEKYYFITSDTNQNMRLNNTQNVSGNIGIVQILGTNCNNTSSYHLIATAGGNQFNVFGNGTYGTSSDIRLKKNIETARNGYLEDIDKIRVVKYNWNNQEDTEAKELGVIAQELEQIFPKMVQDGAKIDENEPFKIVKYSVFIPMLIKAIQELSAQNKQLEDRIYKLENK
jgi:hypothetical protein